MRYSQNHGTAARMSAWDSFEKRATEAIQYAVGNPETLTGHLDYVRRKAESKGLLP